MPNKARMPRANSPLASKPPLAKTSKSKAKSWAKLEWGLAANSCKSATDKLEMPLAVVLSLFIITSTIVFLSTL